MRFINDDNLVLEVNAQRLARIGLEEQVVRQRDELGGLDGSPGGIVWAYADTTSFRDEVLDITDSRQYVVARIKEWAFFSFGGKMRAACSACNVSCRAYDPPDN